MFWIGQEIAKDEKHKVLSLHASGSTIILCDVLSGLTIFFLIVLPFTIITYSFLEKEFLSPSQFIYYFIWFAIFGRIAGRLLRKFVPKGFKVLCSHRILGWVRQEKAKSYFM